MGSAARKAGASAEQTALPSRHGSDMARARSVALRLLRADGDQPLGPSSGAQWDLLGRGLLCGDEPADRLAAWLLAVIARFCQLVGAGRRLPTGSWADTVHQSHARSG